MSRNVVKTVITESPKFTLLKQMHYLVCVCVCVYMCIMCFSFPADCIENFSFCRDQ